MAKTMPAGSTLRKPNPKRSFLDFLGEPEDSRRRQTPGIYDSLTLGPVGKRVQFILLDTRYFRTALMRAPVREKGKGPYAPNQSKEAGILGETQWKWLEKTLGEPAEIRILASSIQVLSTTHGWETWGNFPENESVYWIFWQRPGRAGSLFLAETGTPPRYRNLRILSPLPFST